MAMAISIAVTRPFPLRRRRSPPGTVSVVSSHAGLTAPIMTVDASVERIRKLLSNVELSVSSYDTAWVAMVPTPNSSRSPCFPDCLNWLMDHQLSDGSWGHHPLLLKDSLSSTLACILALKRWSVGEDQINKGIRFIESNFASATDENQRSPLGFDIIFPGMLEYAQELNLQLPLKQTDVGAMLHRRELELNRCQSQEKDVYLAYVSEGLGKAHDWNMVMKYQMSNGSLFNSPSATATAAVHRQNSGCLNYLTSVVERFGNAVPAVYPLDLYLRLCTVNNLERLGFARHFRVEIQNVLDETYRRWVQGDEQIFMDVLTCALAFRVLRTNGYEVSSDPLARITKEGAYMNSLKEPFKAEYAALEVHKASLVMYQDELASGEQNLKLTDFLKDKISNASINKEVENALKFPFNASLERIASRRNIEHYNVENTRILKTAYRSSNISNKDYLRLAVEDFNKCQSIYREEVKALERWVVDHRLDQLKFARQKMAYCYFSAASTLFPPELSDARISWAKSGILTTVVDDFFDVGGSMDELVNLIQLVEKWDADVESDCCSQEVRILFLALKDAICWIDEKAFKWQSRSVRSHVVETWMDLMKSMLREAEWTQNNRVPTIDEYMENAYVSFASGPIVLPALYLVGPKLSDEIVRSSEYHNLFELMSTYGRLQNDIQGFKREFKEGKLNAVALRGGGGGKDEAVEEMRAFIDDRRRRLMKLVLQEKGSVVPKACKDVFWNMSNVLKLFYAEEDGFTANTILDVVKEIIYEPVSLPAHVCE